MQLETAEQDAVSRPRLKLATVLLVAGIFVATLAPVTWINAALSHVNLPPAVQSMTHVLMFIALAVVLLRAWPALGLWRLLGLTLLLAVITETLQHFAIGRHPSLQGVAYDMAGVCLGLVGSAAMRATWSRTPTPGRHRSPRQFPEGDG